MTSWVGYLSIIELIIIIAGVIGGALALRSGFVRAKDEITERVTGLLKTENDLLQRRVKVVEGQLRLLIRYFGKQGVQIAFDGDDMTVRDTKTGAVTVLSREADTEKETT